MKRIGCILICSPLALAAETELLPLPEELFPQKKHNRIEGVDLESLQRIGDSSAPNVVSVDATDARLSLDSSKETILYRSDRSPIQLLTDTGNELRSHGIELDLRNKEAQLDGNITIYSGDSLARAEHAHYNWQHEEGSFHDVRIKSNGILISASSGAYLTDKEGVKYIQLKDAHVSTHDIKDPSFWIGFKDLQIYPGDRLKARGLSVGSKQSFTRVPLLGYIPFSHSLNPKEGYLPLPGSRGIWGLYLLNSYGVLIGNRRVENFMPTSDYILTNRLDYRELRGIGFGIDVEEPAKLKKFPAMTGLSLYYTNDLDPQQNPTSIPRPHIDSHRYRIALQGIWDFNRHRADYWRFKANINAVSDSRFLSDYFEELSEDNDKPDNTVTLLKKEPYSERSVFMRFDPNNYYTTDERLEFNYYRVRQPIAKSRINYESRNSVSYMRQRVPLEDRVLYEQQLTQIADPAARDYYMRLLNEEAYLRISSIHEFTTDFKVFGIFNVVPKLGFAYNGYYGFQEIEDDTRLSAYFATDVSMKFQRQFRSLRSDYFKIDGITHIFQPYASYSYHNMSSSNPLIPQVNSWTTSQGSSTSIPMPQDINSFSGTDGWNDWSTLRLGFLNFLSTRYDGELRRLLRWNTFFNINLDQSNSLTEYSNLYSVLEFNPSERLEIISDIQVPIIGQNHEFSSTSHTISYQATRWMEIELGHRYTYSDALQYKSEQINWKLSMRLNEKYSFASEMYIDTERNTIPLQQYSIFRNMGAWHLGGTLFLRDNGGVRETGLGFSFSLIEANASVPVNFF